MIEELWVSEAWLSCGCVRFGSLLPPRVHDQDPRSWRAFGEGENGDPKPNRPTKRPGSGFTVDASFPVVCHAAGALSATGRSSILPLSRIAPAGVPNVTHVPVRSSVPT